MNSGIQRLSNKGVNVVFVYGVPNYYGKFEFNPDVASRFSPPYEIQYPFGWQAIALNEDVITDSAVTISCVAPLRDPELW